MQILEDGRVKYEVDDRVRVVGKIWPCLYDPHMTPEMESAIGEVATVADVRLHELYDGTIVYLPRLNFDNGARRSGFVWAPEWLEPLDDNATLDLMALLEGCP